MPGTTIIDRLKAKGYVATKTERWSIGALARDEYERRYGSLPPKELRQKTDGSGGTHCFAAYPDEFIPVIDQIIGEFKLADDLQGTLF